TGRDSHRPLTRIFHQTGRAPMRLFSKPSPSPSRMAARFVRLACAVFDGRFAPDLGLLSSPIVAAIGFVGCTQFRTQTVSPNSRALAKHPGLPAQQPATHFPSPLNCIVLPLSAG